MSLDEPEELWEQGYIPTSHQLKAALQVARRLSPTETPITHLRAGYVHILSDGLFDARDFRMGEEILVRSGAARRTTDGIYLTDSPFLDSTDLERQVGLLMTYLTSSFPPWLGSATRGEELHLESVPDEAIQALAGTLPDPADREALLLQLGNQFNDHYQRELGRKGEELVVAECRQSLCANARPDLAELVAHVSQQSDMLGYDVTTPTLSEETLRLEVKTSGRGLSPLQIFISRNEARRAKEDASWRLVVCHRQEDGRIAVVGWCLGADLLPLLPSDSQEGRWMSAELEIRTDLLVEGLPL